MALGAREVARQPLPELPRAADVEEASVLAEESIDAGHRRHVGETIERDVHLPRRTVGRLALVREQIAEPRDALPDQPLEEDTQHLGRDLRVAEPAMAVEHRDAERARDA